MFPWDFGLINALKNLLNVKIFPSEPPIDMQCKKPYIILEIKDFAQNINLTTRLNFRMSFVYDENIMPNYFDVISLIKKATADKLTLSQGKFQIGTAQIKLDKFANKKNTLILDLTALLQLTAIYEDDEEISDDD
ncbi:MAG: hypothetical protein E7015_03150 [Alphaproteobacteria bacterium]|nr:hypothetical protein [Alphaproteobacteria bacterium]